jgi:hypothetical protein
MRKARGPALALAALISLSGVSLWLEIRSHESPPHDREQPTKSKRQNSQSANAIPNSIGAKASGNGKQEGEWYSTFSEHSTEWLIAFFNGLLVYVTYRLVKTTGDLRRSTDNLWKSAQQQAKQMQESIGLARDQIKLARDEFISTHRPRIILREAITGALMDGAPIAIICHFANIGETKGTIIRSSIDVNVFSGDRVLIHGSIEVKNDLGKIILGPSTATLIRFRKEAPNWNHERFGTKTFQTTDGFITRRDPKIHLIGQIMYMDDLGVPRRTAFVRELVPERQRFYRIPDEPDLDYAD